MPITEILKHGRENAIRAEILAAKLETTPRGLRRQIMLAREQGEIILYAPRRLWWLFPAERCPRGCTAGNGGVLPCSGRPVQAWSRRYCPGSPEVGNPNRPDKFLERGTVNGWQKQFYPLLRYRAAP